MADLTTDSLIVGLASKDVVGDKDSEKSPVSFLQKEVEHRGLSGLGSGCFSPGLDRTSHKALKDQPY